MTARTPFRLAIFSLNQWAQDFDGNLRRIMDSNHMANQSEAMYRAGPELEVTGYSLEDAFYEQDTLMQAWKSLLKILEHSANMDMIVDIGMPVYFGSLFNCRVLCHKGRILFIRAKTELALEGNYRESRHFSAWDSERGMTPFRLPKFVAGVIKQTFVPFGSDFILELSDLDGCDQFRVGWEICQELWMPKNTSSTLYQDFGCHLVINGSGSYWELRKLSTVLDMAKGISLRGGACYAYSNLVGCDGQRYVFYGRSCIFDRGQCVAMTPTDAAIFEEVQMLTYDVIASDIDAYRAQMGIRPSASRLKGILDLGRELNEVDMHKDYNRFHMVCPRVPHVSMAAKSLVPFDLHIRFEREIHIYVSLWLWDYLRRSGAAGFMLPLSGGLDSSSVAVLVYGMCCFITANANLKTTVDYFRKVHDVDIDSPTLRNPRALCKLLLKCSYLSTKYSGEQTRNRAKALSEHIGAQLSEVNIQETYDTFRCILTGGQAGESVTLLDQNLQARLRMAATYYISGGNRLVLATGNVDEGIVGYLTKYDCSSADINPIGGLCKNDLKSYLIYCCDHVYQSEAALVAVLRDIIAAPPSAELTGSEQRDEDEIGLTYDEISILGKVRKGMYGPNGPLGAFESIWSKRDQEPFRSMMRCFRCQQSTKGQKAEQLANIVKRFFKRYATNRHKLTVLTPALHAETYSPDDNRFDHRQFLSAPLSSQFREIDCRVITIKSER